MMSATHKAREILDLVTLFQRVPPLLHACIDDNVTGGKGKDIAHLRSLRLVNMECSRVAPLGLSSYTLILGCPAGYEKDTNVGGARLLQHARLERLKLNLRLAGSYNAAPLLKEFLLAVCAALSKVTKLVLRYEDLGISTEAASVMADAMDLLAATCPSLRSLSFRGHLPVTFLRNFGSMCPLLTELTIDAGDKDLAYLQEVMLLQPSLLPNISTLTLPGLAEVLPDMSQNTGIVSIEMPNLCISKDTDWSCLPHKLQHLSCCSISAGSLFFTNNSNLFSSLLSVHVKFFVIDLHALTLILKQAPFPYQIQKCCLNIHCEINQSTVADLDILRLQMQIGAIKGVDFHIHCDWQRLDDDLFPAFRLGLPSMPGITNCTLDCMDADLVPVLAALPDAQMIFIDYSDALTDLELHSLTACKKLKRIELFRCNNVTPMGLLAFCQSMPRLEHVGFDRCDLLQGHALDLCVQLLQRYSSQVVIRDHALEQYEVHEDEAGEVSD